MSSILAATPFGNKSNVLFILFLMVFTFIMIRCVCRAIIFHRLNTSARKKRLKGQSIKEWLFYSKFKDVIPQSILFIYFITPVIHLLITIFFIGAFIGKFNETILINVVRITGFSDLLLLLILSFLFRNTKAIERLTPKHGNKKKRM